MPATIQGVKSVAETQSETVHIQTFFLVSCLLHRGAVAFQSQLQCRHAHASISGRRSCLRSCCSRSQDAPMQHHVSKHMSKEKAHQTSSPTILSTAVKAVRGAVVAVGVCVHNRALSTERTRSSMTTTDECECECECECMYCCWVLHSRQ